MAEARRGDDNIGPGLWGQSPETGLRAQLLRGGTGSLAVKLASVVLGLVLVALLARTLGAEGYGVYAFVLALASLASAPTQLGLAPLVVRETAHAQARNDWSSLRGIWRWATAVAALYSLVVISFGLVGLQLGWFNGLGLPSTLSWGLLLILLLSLGGIRTAALRGLRHVLAGLLPEQVLRPVFLLLLLSLAAALMPQKAITPEVAMGLTVIAVALAFLVGAWLLYRHRPAALLGAKPTYRHRVWLAAAWPLVLTQGFRQLNQYADVLLLGVLASAADVGIYRVAAQGALMVSLGLTALNMAIAPFIARLHTLGETAKLQKLAKRTAQAALAFALPTVMVFVLFGEWLLATVFGAEFAEGYTPLLILAAGQLANAAFGTTGLLLNMTGFERDVTRVVAVAAVLNLVLNIALIPPLGVSGAAIATATTLVFWNAWLWLRVSKRLGIRSSFF